MFLETGLYNTIVVVLHYNSSTTLPVGRRRSARTQPEPPKAVKRLALLVVLLFFLYMFLETGLNNTIVVVLHYNSSTTLPVAHRHSVRTQPELLRAVASLALLVGLLFLLYIFLQTGLYNPLVVALLYLLDVGASRARNKSRREQL